MNQKLAWGMALAGVTGFLGQFADLVASHSTWSAALSPASMPDVTRLLITAIVAVAGSFGIRPVQPAVKTVAAPKKKKAAVRPGRILTGLAIAAFAVSVTSCVGALAGGTPPDIPSHSGTVAPLNAAPTAEQIQATRQMAVRVADATTFGLDMSNEALKVADMANKAGALSDDKLRTLALAAKKFGGTAKLALDQLGQVMTNPSLRVTVKLVLDDLQPLLSAMENSGNPALAASATALRFGTKLLPSFLGSPQ
jgi:hypothetical protein